MDRRDGQVADERGIDLGVVRLDVKRLRSLKITRSPGRAAPPDSGVVQLVAPLCGTFRAVWGDRHSEVGVGDLYAHDITRVREITVPESAGREPFVMAAVTVPRPLLPFPDRQMDAVMGQELPADGGVGALLTGFIRDLAGEKGTLSPSDGPRLGLILLDLVAAFFSTTIETGAGAAPQAPRQGLTLRIQAFIQRHLHDPDLTPRTIAAAHHISLSYLHRLFQERGETVASLIRNRRLRSARRDLADPALVTAPIHVIAARWGFSHSAAFSRAFRSAYGLSPRDFRTQALQPALLPGTSSP